MQTNNVADPDGWVNQHGDALYRYALFRVRNTQIAEDLVQETFLAGLRAWESFAGRSSVRTWLFGILKHKIIDHIRKSIRERPQEDIAALSALRDEPFDETGRWKSGPAKWTSDPGLIYQQQEFWEVLQSCLSELTPRLQQAFTLRELDGLSIDEICKIMNVSATNGGVMLHRARLRLRGCLEINWLGGDEEKE
jgi:RNA polymerase sigma-70 factor (ECF subfamily)